MGTGQDISTFNFTYKGDSRTKNEKGLLGAKVEKKGLMKKSHDKKKCVVKDFQA